jgi:hypothetical protein
MTMLERSQPRNGLRHAPFLFTNTLSQIYFSGRWINDERMAHSKSHSYDRDLQFRPSKERFRSYKKPWSLVSTDVNTSKEPNADLVQFPPKCAHYEGRMCADRSNSEKSDSALDNVVMSRTSAIRREYIPPLEIDVGSEEFYVNRMNMWFAALHSESEFCFAAQEFSNLYLSRLDEPEEDYKAARKVSYRDLLIKDSAMNHMRLSHLALKPSISHWYAIKMAQEIFQPGSRKRSALELAARSLGGPLHIAPPCGLGNKSTVNLAGKQDKQRWKEGPGRSKTWRLGIILVSSTDT